MADHSYVTTAESVTEGHPDKVADQISDAVLDAALGEDPGARVACEVLVTEGRAVVAGETRTRAGIDVEPLVRDTVTGLGYTRADLGFAAESLEVEVLLHEQSPEIARGVDQTTGRPSKAGAGDQGLMVGYAAHDTKELMPLPIQAAHALARSLTAARRERRLGFLRPDGKTQVAVRYEGARPVEIVKVLVSAQHEPGVTRDEIREGLWERVVMPALPPELFDPRRLREAFLANPTGSFTLGGPAADTGLTGRKTAVDTYGGAARHGGGCFSGKDPSKVDRTGAYAARWVAKNLVAAGFAERCEVEIAYAIGRAEPFSLRVGSFGTSAIGDQRLAEIVAKAFDLRPGAIRSELDLERPIYRPLAAYGHFGRPELDLPWERLDRVDALSAHA